MKEETELGFTALISKEFIANIFIIYTLEHFKWNNIFVFYNIIII
jgi:hypothetical protein